MNTDRLLRDVEKRLERLPETVRAEVLDAIREEFARERRWLDVPGDTVERERERRIEAETLREVLEAINRPARLEDTIDAVLKQLSRIVTFDACSLALLQLDGSFRIIAGLGFPEPENVIGTSFHDPLSDALRVSHWPLSLQDVREDSRFVSNGGRQQVRSWAGIPLLVEGEVIGAMCLERHRVDAFEEEDLHRARAVAFSAAAALRRAQLLEQVRRYAGLMERVVEVDQAVFAGRPTDEVAQLIVAGALRLGAHPGGLFVEVGPDGPRAAAAAGDLESLAGQPASPVLAASQVTRLSAGEAEALGLPKQPVRLVPLSTAQGAIGTLALLDPSGEASDDRLMEAYAARAASAYLHALRGGTDAGH